jgi:hypothetical protein
VRWKRRAHGLRYFEWETRALVGRSAVLIGAVIGERREKFVQQIAVGAMDFNPIETAAIGTARGVDKLIANAREALVVELFGNLPARGECFGRRTFGTPSAVFRENSVALP